MDVIKQCGTDRCFQMKLFFFNNFAHSAVFCVYAENINKETENKDFFCNKTILYDRSGCCCLCLLKIYYSVETFNTIIYTAVCTQNQTS